MSELMDESLIADLPPALRQELTALAHKVEAQPVTHWLPAVLYFLSRFDDKDQSWEARDGYTRLVLEPLRKHLARRIQQDRWE